MLLRCMAFQRELYEIIETISSGFYYILGITSWILNISMMINIIYVKIINVIYAFIEYLYDFGEGLLWYEKVWLDSSWLFRW